MKRILLTFSTYLIVLVTSCSKQIDYPPEFIEKTSGRYLYSPDETLEVYYQDNQLLLKWRGAERIKPVVLDQHTFFVADMYKKLRFAQHPSSGDYYLATVDAEDEEKLTYDYKKLADTIHIPSVYLKNGEFEKALAGYLAIQAQDPDSYLIEEYEFNRLGYDYLRDENYKQAIDVFKLNVALYPASSNVYDSLADAYKRSGDSVQAYENYKKALEINSENQRAIKFIEAYTKQTDSL